MAASAQGVFAGAAVGCGRDPGREVLAMEGAMRSMMGDVEGAVTALERWLLSNPDRELGEHWWWRNVSGDPAFERLRDRH